MGRFADQAKAILKSHTDQGVSVNKAIHDIQSSFQRTIGIREKLLEEAKERIDVDRFPEFGTALGNDEHMIHFEKELMREFDALRETSA
jgi:hypothetical protein